MFCQKCGTKINEKDLFCSNCGARIKYENYRQKSEELDKKRKQSQRMIRG